MKLFRRFISYYRPYRRMFWFDTACAVIVCAIDLAFPQLLRWLVRGPYTGSPEQVIRAALWVGAAMLVMHTIRFGCQYYITAWGHIMGARMESDMRQDLFDHYQKLSFSYYDRNNTGEMMSRLMSDLFDISELAHHGPEHLLLSGLKISGSFVLLSFLNVPLTLILTFLTLAMGYFNFKQNLRMRRIFADNRRKIAGVNAQLQDSLSGIRVVKSFANEDLEHHKFEGSNLTYLASKTENNFIMGQFHAGNSLLQGALYLSILTFGGLFIAWGQLKPADLAVYALYVGIFIRPLEVLINFTEQFQKGYAGFRRFCEVLETAPDIRERPDARDLTNVKGDIKFSGVAFHYGSETDVLHSVDIHIPAGKTVALAGPSGGGKSTICALLPRFYDVSAGVVAIDGNDVRDLKLKSLRNAIGIVQQDVYLFNGTIGENIGYGKPGATPQEIEQAAGQADIADFINTLPNRYETLVGERGARLSGGQKQRIAIARVFLKNPKILILDEATSALDNESERHIQMALERLSRGRTTLVIAHRLSTIRHADEIIVVTSGRVLERGTHEQLLCQNGVYARYCRMQDDDFDKTTLPSSTVVEPT